MLLLVLAIPLTSSIPILTGDDLKTFLQNSQRAVVFFLAGVLHVEENGYDIGRFRGQIDVIESTMEEGLNYNCSAFPCLVPFADGISLKSSAVPHYSTSFAEWLQYIISIDTIQINTTDQADILLQGNGSYIFAVDYYDRPLNVPSGVTIYLIPSILLHGEVSKGIYAFNPFVHQFTPLFYAKADFPEGENIKFGAKPFLAGFIIRKGVGLGPTRTDLLRILSKKFPTITFSALSGRAAKLLKRQGGLELLSPPYFFVFDTKSPDKKRWIVTGDEMDNTSFLVPFLLKIIKNQAPETIISEEPPSEPSVVVYRQLVGRTFEAAIGNAAKESVVLVAGSRSSRTRKLERMMQKAAFLLQHTDVLFYHIDATRNQIPAFVEKELFGLPTVLVWPSGRERTEPVLYGGKAKVENFLVFLNGTLVTKFPMPDLTAIESRLAEETHDL
jgi:hypothetical protein